MEPGKFNSVTWVFGADCRFGFVDYSRPKVDGDKQCVRVQAEAIGADRRVVGEPLRMELTLSNAAALLAVLSGEAESCGQALSRDGLEKRFGCLQMARPRPSAAYAVLLRENDRELKCTLSDDDALGAATTVLQCLVRARGGLTEDAWLQQVRRHGAAVARRYAAGLGRKRQGADDAVP